MYLFLDHMMSKACEGMVNTGDQTKSDLKFFKVVFFKLYDIICYRMFCLFK